MRYAFKVNDWIVSPEIIIYLWKQSLCELIEENGWAHEPCIGDRSKGAVQNCKATKVRYESEMKCILVTCSYSFYYSNRSFSQRTQTLMVIIWTLRLGMYLFSRGLERGDKRLDKYVEKPIKFLIPFTIQILWVYIMMLPTVAFNQIENPVINNFRWGEMF